MIVIKLVTLKAAPNVNFYSFVKGRLLFLVTLPREQMARSQGRFVKHCKKELSMRFMLRGGFVEHLSLTEVAQQSVTKIIHMTIMNLVTPKAGAKHELLFNK
jgi:hypothetical protein